MIIVLRRVAGFVTSLSPTSIERVRHTLSVAFLTRLTTALRGSAPAQDTRAPDAPPGTGNRTPAAIKADLSITRRQREMLIDIYEAFRKENHAAAAQARQVRARPNRPGPAPVHGPDGHGVPGTGNGRA